MAKSFAVLGMGRFGRGVALCLARNGEEVLIVDKDEELIDQYAPEVTYAVTADLSDEQAVKELGLGNMDAVVVAMGMDLEASILCVMIAKEAGAGKVLAKAGNRRMGDILTRIGADRIIYPEEEMGERTARALLSRDILDYFNLSDSICMVEMRPRKEWIGKTLRELNLRENFRVNLVAVRTGEGVNHLLDADKPLGPDVILLMAASKKDLKKLTD